jgi:hypothetical protein
MVGIISEKWIVDIGKCQYPPQSSSCSTWAQNHKDPVDNWPVYEIQVLYRTSKYECGLFCTLAKNVIIFYCY